MHLPGVFCTLLDITIELDAEASASNMDVQRLWELSRKLTSRRVVDDRAVSLPVGMPDDPTQPIV
jgi:hypothetical protein